MKPKSGLVRVVKSPLGAIALDVTKKAPGRGAYVCPSTDCLKRARKMRAFERAFGKPISGELEARLFAEMTEVPYDG